MCVNYYAVLKFVTAFNGEFFDVYATTFPSIKHCYSLGPHMHTKQGLRLPQNMRIKKANLQTTVSRIILIFWLNEWGIIQLHVNCDQESKWLKLEGVFVLYYIGGDPVHYGWVG